ncbi:hypothetical protein RQP46_003739 [Phenoliferia psychrophenolica]
MTAATTERVHWLQDSEGLAGLPALKSLKLHLAGKVEPIGWILSRETFNATIGTLPPSARLSQLSLPTGKLSSLNNITPFLDEPVLLELKELLLPNIYRGKLGPSRFGGELLEACDVRGIRVVLHEDLELLMALPVMVK